LGRRTRPIVAFVMEDRRKATCFQFPKRRRIMLWFPSGLLFSIIWACHLSSNHYPQEEVEALRKEAGEEQFALLLSTVEPQADQMVKLALA
jgi:hypothetical protein